MPPSLGQDVLRLTPDRREHGGMVGIEDVELLGNKRAAGQNPIVKRACSQRPEKSLVDLEGNATAISPSGHVDSAIAGFRRTSRAAPATRSPNLNSIRCARGELTDEIVEADGNFSKRSPPAEIVVVGSDIPGRMVMLRKMVIALLEVASVGMASPTMALARGGGGGGGGFHGGGMSRGGFHGGMAGGSRDGGGFHNRGGFRDRDGGFRGRGFHDRDSDFGRRFGFYPDDDYAYDPCGYNDTYYDDGSCHVVQRRVHTRHGWRLQPRQVCG
jgi:hypothetical protein